MALTSEKIKDNINYQEGYNDGIVISQHCAFVGEMFSNSFHKISLRYGIATDAPKDLKNVYLDRVNEFFEKGKPFSIKPTILEEGRDFDGLYAFNAGKNQAFNETWETYLANNSQPVLENKI